MAAQRGSDVCHALVTLQYATHVSVAQAIAAVTQTTYIPVSQLAIDESIILRIPESVARENHVLPIADSDSSLTVVMSNPQDLETIEKLRFILNRNINAFCGASDEIGEAINRFYGQIEGESADSILQEFTDSQIDFTETEDPLERLITRGQVDPFTSGFYEDSFESAPSPSPRRRAPASAPARPEMRLSFGDSLTFGDSASFNDEEVYDESDDDIRAAIVRFVGLLLHEAVQLQATHVLLTRQKDEISVVYLIDGRVMNRDQGTNRLWLPILNRIKLMAKLNIADREGVKTGGIKITIGTDELDLIVHTARESLMIELPSAKLLPAIPAEIENWWIMQRSAVNNS